MLFLYKELLTGKSGLMSHTNIVKFIFFKNSFSFVFCFFLKCIQKQNKMWEFKLK